MNGQGHSLKEDLDHLIKEHPAEVLYTETNIQPLADNFFRSYNIEHSGHDIKSGAQWLFFIFK